MRIESVTPLAEDKVVMQLNLCINVEVESLVITDDRITITFAEQMGNMVDTTALRTLLDFFKSEQLVSYKTQTFWIGAANNKVFAWAKR